MRIAIFGWGSLIWDSRDLPITGDWNKGGPVLPIEFSRISDNGRLTLVIDERNGADVPTRYALSSRGDLEQAIADLQKREGTTRDRIGFVDRQHQRDCQRAAEKHPNALKIISSWATAKAFDAVIWTALGPRFCKQARYPIHPPKPPSAT